MSNDFFGKLIFGKYQLTHLLGKGSFGFVYKGINKLTGEDVAIKLEEYKKMGNILESEAYFLFALKNVGIPEVKSFGIYGKYKLLVQKLLGDSLETIFIHKRRKFPLKDVCMIAIQLLDRLEFIHSKYVIHRDIKPENILVDLETKRIIYLIDFGLAKKYRSGRTKKHILFTVPKRLTGTARYASVNALRGTEQSRRDDLESAAYVFIYFAQKGDLPWQGLNITDKLRRYRKIYEIKRDIKPEELCKGLPSEFCEYIKYVKGLQFEEDPKYNYLKGLFINVLNRIQFNYNDFHFSWITQKEIDNYLKNKHSRNSCMSKKKRCLRANLLRNIQTSKEKEKNMQKIPEQKLLSELEEKQEQREKESIIKRNNEKLNLNKKIIINNEEKKISENSKNVKHCDNSIDKYGTQITQFNVSVNVEDVDEKIKKDEKMNNLIDNNKNKNNIINKEVKEYKNTGNNTHKNRPIRFDGSFDNAPLIECRSQDNIKKNLIGKLIIHNSRNQRNTIQTPFLSEEFIKNNIIDKKNNNENKNNKDNQINIISNKINPKKIVTNKNNILNLKVNDIKNSKIICKSQGKRTNYQSPIDIIKYKKIKGNNIISNININNNNKYTNLKIINLKRINNNELNNSKKYFDITKKKVINYNNNNDERSKEFILDRIKSNKNNINYNQNFTKINSCNSLFKSNSKTKNINKVNIKQLLMQKSAGNIKANKSTSNIKRNKVEIKSLENDFPRKRKMFKGYFINKLPLSNRQYNYKINNDNYFNNYNHNTSRNSPYKNNNIENTYSVKPNKIITIYKKDSNNEKLKTIKLNLNKNLILNEEENNNNTNKKNNIILKNNYNLNNNIYNNSYINSTKNNYNLNIINNNSLINPNIKANIFYTNNRNLNKKNINIELERSNLYTPHNYKININNNFKNDLFKKV